MKCQARVHRPFRTFRLHTAFDANNSGDRFRRIGRLAFLYAQTLGAFFSQKETVAFTDVAINAFIANQPTLAYPSRWPQLSTRLNK